MGTIPAPNIAELGGQIAAAPQNAFAEYARVAALKQQTALEQQQTEAAQQQNQQNSLQIQDSQTLRKLAPQYVTRDDSGKVTGYDYPGLYGAAAGAGVSPKTIQGLQLSGVDLQKQVLGLNKDQLDYHDKLNQQAYENIEAVKGVSDPVQRQAAYSKAITHMQQSGLDTNKLGFPQQAPPTDDGLSVLEVPLGMHKQALADQATQSKAQEDAAKARQENAEAVHTEYLNNLQKNATPQDFEKVIDSLYDPNSTATGGVNRQTKMMVYSAFQTGGLPAAQKVMDSAFQNELGTQKDIAVATNPQVQQGKVNVAAAEGAARANVEAQIARGSNAALAQVPKELIGPATSAATKAGEDYAQSQSVTQRLGAMMDAAKHGNVVSYQLIPEEGALQVTTSQGVHRINMAEIQNYGGGSLWQRMQGHLGKALTGESIPDSVLNDMSEMQKIQQQGSQAKYENSLKTINQNYGASFKPITMDSGSQNSSPKATPAGATHIAKGSDGKLHFTNSQGKDLGLAE